MELHSSTLHLQADPRVSAEQRVAEEEDACLVWELCLSKLDLESDQLLLRYGDPVARHGDVDAGLHQSSFEQQSRARGMFVSMVGRG